MIWLFITLLFIFLSLIVWLFQTSDQLTQIDEQEIDKRIVVISGCDTGFGRASALDLAQRGFLVFAGCLNVHKCHFNHRNLIPMQMDVTKIDQMKDCFEQVSEYVENNPGCYLTGVVANAGVSLGLPIEILPDDWLYKIVNVNFYGTVSLFKMFLPLLRRGNVGKRKSLIAVSSMAAYLPGPQGYAAYSATKAAIRQYNSCLRFELSKFGISVSTIYPDVYPTEAVVNIKANEQLIESTIANVYTKIPVVVDDYGGPRTIVTKCKKELNLLPTLAHKSLKPMTDAIFHALASDSPKNDYFPINLDVKIGFFISKLSDSLFSMIINKLYD